MSTEVVVIEAENEIEVIEIGIAGPQGVPGVGLPGPPGAVGGTFEHTQGVPSAVWAIVHNLGYHPGVSVFDSVGREVVGIVAHVSANELTVSFDAAFGGVAYLS